MNCLSTIGDSVGVPLFALLASPKIRCDKVSWSCLLLIYLSNLNNNDWIAAEPLAINDNKNTIPKSIITYQ